MRTARLKFIGAMGIFGTVGIFVSFIPLPSATIAFCRSVLGFIFLVLLLGAKRQMPDWKGIGSSLWVLLLSGAALGGNWILLFEAYRFPGSSVATATICYYLAPLFVVLASPLLGEKLSPKKLLCVAVALIGMVPVSGVLRRGAVNLGGVALGVGAAVLYACVMLLNKKYTGVGAHDKTLVQLFASAGVIFPYLLFTGGLDFPAMEPLSWVLLAVVGIVHTGLAYFLYFGAVGRLKAQTVAILSYLDPVLSIILSALILREHIDIFTLVGAVMILGSAMFSELSDKEAPGAD